MKKQGRHISAKKRRKRGLAVKLNKRQLIIAAAVLLIVAAVILLLCLRSDPEDMAVDYLDAVFGGNGQDVWDVMNMDAVLELAIDAGNVTDENADSETEKMVKSFDDNCKLLQNACKEKYGDDWSYEIDVVKSEDMKESELEQYGKNIDSDIEVTEGVKVTCSISYSGSLGSDKDETVIYVLKINGDWIVMGD